MSNPFLLKLQSGVALTPEDQELVRSVIGPSFEVPAGTDLIHEGERPANCHLVLEGLACRYKTLPDGTRSIVAYMLPGDLCDMHVAILDQMDHCIATVARCKMAYIAREGIERLLLVPRIARALWWATLVDAATLREWLVNMGRRPADRQMAHLLCELHTRYEAVERTSGGSFRLPVTQTELGDTLGLSAVHVNRIIQQLRDDGLIILQSRMMTIPNVARLVEFAGFNPNYLHLRPLAQAPAQRPA